MKNTLLLALEQIHELLKQPDSCILNDISVIVVSAIKQHTDFQTQYMRPQKFFCALTIDGSVAKCGVVEYVGERDLVVRYFSFLSNDLSPCVSVTSLEETQSWLWYNSYEEMLDIARKPFKGV